MSKQPGVNISIRPITNGYVASATFGVPFKKQSQSGEIYFPDLPAVAEWAQSWVCDAGVCLVEEDEDGKA